jgi:hypothetical protein
LPSHDEVDGCFDYVIPDNALIWNLAELKKIPLATRRPGMTT